MKKRMEIGKYISILQRLGNIYYTNELSPYQIGCGQQFFLLQVFNHPGISLQELAAYGYYDKATATRAVQKLEEEGYVETSTDIGDKRVHHIFATEKAGPVVEKTWESIDVWTDIVMGSFSEEEKTMAEAMLIRMTENASGYIAGHRRKE